MVTKRYDTEFSTSVGKCVRRLVYLDINSINPLSYPDIFDSVWLNFILNEFFRYFCPERCVWCGCVENAYLAIK